MSANEKLYASSCVFNQMSKTTLTHLGAFRNKSDLHHFFVRLKDHQNASERDVNSWRDQSVFNLGNHDEESAKLARLCCVQNGKIVQRTGCWQQVGFDDGTYVIHPV